MIKCVIWSLSFLKVARDFRLSAVRIPQGLFRTVLVDGSTVRTAMELQINHFLLVLPMKSGISKQGPVFSAYTLLSVPVLISFRIANYCFIHWSF